MSALHRSTASSIRGSGVGSMALRSRPRHHRHLAPPPPRRRHNAALAASSSSSSSPVATLEAALEAALAELTPDQRLLPAWDEATSAAKRRCVEAAEALERAAAAEAASSSASSSSSSPSAAALPKPAALAGEWDLALAGSGTVVTRTPLVKALSALSRGSDSYGLGRIRQVLSSPSPSSPSSSGGDVCCRASNEAELKLGPLLGSWRVAVRGAWRRPRLVAPPHPSLLPGALVVDVAFDELLIGPVDHGGGHGHHGNANEDDDANDRRALRLPLPQRVRRAARKGGGTGGSGGGGGSVEWATTYLGDRWRIGRGVRSSNLFVFRRRGVGG